MFQIKKGREVGRAQNARAILMSEVPLYICTPRAWQPLSWNYDIQEYLAQTKTPSP